MVQNYHLTHASICVNIPSVSLHVSSLLLHSSEMQTATPVVKEAAASPNEKLLKKNVFARFFELQKSTYNVHGKF